jgi:predicted PurR-regulated permease PerM
MNERQSPGEASGPLGLPGESASRIENMVALTALVFLAVGCLLVLRPFITALLWALILSFSTWPIFDWLRRHMKGRATWAALAMTLVVALVLVLPLVVVGVTLADSVTVIVDRVREWLTEGPPPPPPWVADIPLVGGRLTAFWQGVAHDGAKLTAELVPYLGTVRDIALSTGASWGGAVLELMLSVVTLFFFYRDGHAGVHRLQSALERVAGERAQRLLQVAGSTIKGVVYGILGTALAQAGLAALGFWVAGIPGAFFLGFLTFFLSLVPAGPPIVWLPATIWLFHNGETGWAIALGLWCLFVVSGVDNVLKPYLISKGGELPLILVLLGVLGGAIAFGFIGFFLGPTLLAIAYTLVQEWTPVGEDRDDGQAMRPR